MIERNLGNAERLVRLLMGLSLFVWSLQQSGMNGIVWFVVLVAVALVLNGIFSRCYLWFLLDINTCQGREQEGRVEPTCP